MSLLLMRLLAGYRLWYVSLRLLVYMAIILVVYLINAYQPAYLSGADPFTYIFFGVLVAAIGLSLRFANEEGFNVTPTDYLILIAVPVLVALANTQIVDSGMTAMVLKTIILLYGCELVLKRMVGRWNVFTVSVLLSLLVVAVRGVMGNYF